MVRRNFRCSVRERRISATGPGSACSSVRSPEDSVKRQRHALVRAERDVGRSLYAQCERTQGGAMLARIVVARIWPSMPNAMSLPVISFSCAASASSSRKPTLRVPRMSGCSGRIADRDSHQLEHAAGLRGSGSRSPCPANACRDRRLIRDDDTGAGRDAHRGEDLSRPCSSRAEGWR